MLTDDFRALAIVARGLGLLDIANELERAATMAGPIVTVQSLGSAPVPAVLWLLSDRGAQTLSEARAGAEAAKHVLSAAQQTHSLNYAAAISVIETVERLNVASMPAADALARWRGAAA